MDDSLMEDSVFDDGASSDFAPPAKPVKATKAAKPKAAAPKKAAAPAKPRGRPAAAAAKPKAKAAPKKKQKDVSEDENSDVDMDADLPDDDESLLADTPPKTKKAPAPKKPSGKPMEEIENESFGDAPKPKKGDASSKYQMVSAQGREDDVAANKTIVVAFGAHHEAPRHVHRFRRATIG
jgi:DNA topoisomerase-2